MVKKISDQAYLDRLQLAVSFRRNGRYDDALQTALDLVKIRPSESSVWHTLGQIYTEFGQFDLALRYHEQAWKLVKSLPNPRQEQVQMTALGYAQCLMRYGRFEEAWPLWEAGRLNVSWTPWTGAERWDGHTLDRHKEGLLVQTEGGYGDTFMFMRWLPLLMHKAGRVGLMLWKPLEGLCDWGELGIDNVYVIDRDKIDFSWQYATSIMSMPAMFGLKRWEDILPWGEFLLKSPKRKPDCRTNIGFCWRAEENSSPVRTKSLPPEVAEEVCRRLYNWDLSGNKVALHSLSPHKADLYNSDYEEAPGSLSLNQDRMVDWKATSRYMQEMDFILTVDTAVAHLAGLLGIPTLVLLPVSSCWRWGFSTTTSSWYGRQLTLCRQKEPLKWDAKEITDAVIGRIYNAKTRTLEIHS